MREFDFLTPRSVDEAIAFMSDREGDVRILAGGTDLLLGMREGTITPHAVMSLKKLPDFRTIDYSNDTGLRLGAMVTLRQIARSTQIRDHYPSLAEAALLMVLSNDPRNQDFFVALVDYYLKSGQPEKARDLAINTLRQFPDHAAAKELMQYLKE